MKINNENINHIGKDNKEESVKFLGIHIDKHLTWKNINIISSKISRAIFAIKRIILKKLYYILLQSHLTYGIQERGNGNTVKKVQIKIKRCTNN